MNLVQLETGRNALVTDLCGGCQFVARLEAMGIRQGSAVLKKSASLLRGPVVVQINDMQIAIGFGMAKKIMVEQIDG